MTEKQMICGFLRSYEAQIRTAAEENMKKQIPALPEELFAMFEKTGNRLLYETEFMTRRSMLTTLGLLALLEKRNNGCVGDKTMQKLQEIIMSVCDEICWALPAHVNRNNSEWELCVDLFAAETAQTLSELADRLREDLPKEVYRRIVQEVNRRVLEPFFTTEQYGWEKADHNWNAVCTGSIGSACLHLLRGEPEKLKCRLKRICDSLIYYIDGFSDDGVCMEGLEYFNYGMCYFVNFAQELLEYSKEKVDLFCGEWGHFHAGEKDKRSKIATFASKCFFQDGRTVNFSDCSSMGKFQVGLTYTLKQHFPDVQIIRLDQAGRPDLNWNRFAMCKMDLFAAERYLRNISDEEIWNSTEEESSISYIFPIAQWCIANSCNGVGMACKGGHNNEPHNHNDVGHFIYETKNVVLLADLGAGEYTKQYFSKDRYSILCNNSLGHSVPIINGQGQQFGRKFHCGKFDSAVTEKTCSVKMELANAYPEKMLQRFDRKIQFSLADGALAVCDEFVTVKEGTEITENLITQIIPVLQENKILLRQNGVAATLTIDGVNPARDVCVIPLNHRNHEGQLETVYSIRWNLKSEDCKAFSSYKIEIKKQGREKQYETI